MAGIIDSQSRVFKTFQGTALYMSPERLKGQEHGFDSDIWSLGLVTAELGVGHLPSVNNIWDLMSQGSNNKSEQHDCIDEIIQSCPSEDMRDFVSLCLKVNPNERAKANELLSHPFITRYADPQRVVKRWLGKPTKSPKKKSMSGPVVFVTGGRTLNDLYD